LSTTLELSELDANIGQLFMAGMPGPDLDTETEALIRDHNLGGIIFFARNIQDPLQIAGLCRDLQRKAMEYQGRPLFLAVDQEGGRVARLREPFTAFPGNAVMGRDARAEERAREFGRITAAEMGLVGLNMDLAPVIDVRRGEPERHLLGRTFGEDPEQVARLGRAVLRALQDNGVMAVAKHFPGLGRADLDPHLQLPRIEVDPQEMEEVNLMPFRAAIEAEVAGIMTSHALYPHLDPDRPATLSSTVLTGLLRDSLGFEGLILTDDLEMGAVAEVWGVAEAAAEAFGAGADILLVCEDRTGVFEGLERIRGRLLRGEIPQRRLVRANERIRAAKSRYLARPRRVSLRAVRDYFKLPA
jgi:beta-N-acetylhexosaminidase